MFVTRKAESFPDRLVPLLKGYGLGKRKIASIKRKMLTLVKSRGIAGTLDYLKCVSSRFKSWLSKGDLSPDFGTWVNFRQWKRWVKKIPQLVKMLTSIHKTIRVYELELDEWSEFDAASYVYGPRPNFRSFIQYVRMGARTLPKVGDCSARPVFNTYAEKALTKTRGDPDRARTLGRKLMLRELERYNAESWLNYECVQQAFAPYPPFYVRELADRLKVKNPCPTDIAHVVGTLNVAHEPGNKKRYFASPSLLAQCAASGLQHALTEVLYELENDFTHDQDACVPFVQSRLADGLTAYCTDLSRATEGIPLEPQLVLMEELGVPRDLIDFTVVIARGFWRCSHEIERVSGVRFHRWNHGQPLGFSPSFAIFSLTLHALYRGIALSLGRRDFRSCYAQLGDDHVGFCRQVEEIANQVLVQSGASINTLKSSQSGRVAEFGGYFIRKDGWAFRPGKWPSVNTDTAISMAADPNFKPELVWPKSISKLVYRLRERPWPFGFSMLPASEFSSQEWEAALRQITRNILREHDTDVFNIASYLSSGVFGQHMVDLEIKCSQRASSGALANANAVRQCRFEAELKLRRKAELYWEQLNIPSGQHVHISSFRDDWYALDNPRSMAYAELVASAWSGEIAASLAQPYIKAVALRKHACEPKKLTSALLESSPFRAYCAYDSHDHSFFRMIRRVARFGEVIPSRLCPSPIRG